MQMFRQNHHGVDGERMPFFHHADNLAEDVNVLYQQVLAPFRKIDGEKIGSAINPCAPVSNCIPPVS
jgi:hypothetical protein